MRWHRWYAVGGRLERTTMTMRGDTDSGPNNKGATADSSTHTFYAIHKPTKSRASALSSKTNVLGPPVREIEEELIGKLHGLNNS